MPTAILSALVLDPNDDLDQKNAKPENILVPASREASIMRTKLEEAAFFARKACASRPENQEKEPNPT